jgi:hypothetical protein
MFVEAKDHGSDIIYGKVRKRYHCLEAVMVGELDQCPKKP